MITNDFIKRMSILLETDSLGEELKIDNREGHGATSYNTDIHYHGVKVMMKPSKFLSVVPDRPYSHSYLNTALDNNESIASPFLVVDTPVGDDFFKADASNDFYVTGHEGRGRMKAILEKYGDAPIEVHLIWGGRRKRHITNEIVEKINSGVYRENTNEFIDGPLFASYEHLSETDIFEDELEEVELIHSVDDTNMDDLKSKYKNTIKQLDLFSDIPTMSPDDLPVGSEVIGRFEDYTVVDITDTEWEASIKKVNPRHNRSHGYAVTMDEHRGYVLMTQDNVVGYLFGATAWLDQLVSNGFYVDIISIDKQYSGKGLAMKLYYWLLANKYAYIIAGDMQTRAGAALWKRLNNSRRFETLVWDDYKGDYRKRWSGKDFDQVYKTGHLIPIVTLPNRKLMAD